MISDSPSPKPQLMQLGVCYYPEHWPESQWANDARRMREIGLTRVRIGEFAWSRIEPESGRFDWAWLDQAIETLMPQGLASSWERPRPRLPNGWSIPCPT